MPKIFTENTLVHKIQKKVDDALQFEYFYFHLHDDWSLYSKHNILVIIV